MGIIAGGITMLITSGERVRSNDRVRARATRIAVIFVALLAGSLFAMGRAANARVTAGGSAANAPIATPAADAYMALLPEGSTPPNGGTVAVGDKVVFGLWLNAGSHVDA